MSHPGPDAGERVALSCPSCSPYEATVHEVLKPGGQVTVRCTECSHVHKEKLQIEKEIETDVIVSQEGDSIRTTVDVPEDETLAVGEEFIVDTPEAIMQVRITSIEVGEEQRADEASAEDVDTVWTRVVDNVTVNVTVNPKDGSRDDTRSLKVQVPGDFEFRVGETEEFGDEKFYVKSVQVRDDASNYRFEQFDREGDMVYAKDVKRVYGRDETTSAWSAW
ncbi:Uncharacterized Zn-finger protein [Halogranum amylolyticum]|uniref:Uncharacterized Zn-finger protein n=1 Tax=Halogranum amylolyticum TaxID=660520 RepID=A0A1H8VY01_9EURY|nr:HVO_0476 family zinc finger protein [Halogranum amylolyticum]SEP20332.1 Uncharacterized Zn-finger protein [Halogranum amylolyticum]